MTSVEPEPEPVPSGERPAWSRTVIIGAAIVAVLLVGATVGLLLSQSLQDDAPATPGADSVEVGFAQDMSTHHTQAVTMANWARDHSTDPEVRNLAFDIETTQNEQVGRMKGWLMLWDQPEQAIGNTMKWMSGGEMSGHGGMNMPSGGAGVPVTQMPGMASSAELAKLRSLTGKELDVEFLQLMLRHHQGGTPMATYAQEHTSLPALKTLTGNILKSQGAEITVMTQMLAERGAKPLPAP
ncbi:DUF305 domain-containing protein [Amycolatopsis sp. CA-230715]|uniref:DUF305 domain-containing protein n=1 Tax=Amycolatopsis sp. CA-230715 TaxID=2745196 RepID=UPI003FA480F4